MPQITDKKKSRQKIAAAKEKYKNQIRELERSYPLDESRSASFNPEIFGSRVRTLRQQSEKTQKDCADNAGMTVAMFSKIELGNIEKLNPDYLYLLSVVLDCSPDYLLGHTDLRDRRVEAKPDGTTQELYCPIKPNERPVSKFEILMMDQVIQFAAHEEYDKIPENVFQLIAILESSNEDLRKEFSASLNHLCKKYDLVVDHFDGKNSVESS